MVKLLIIADDFTGALDTGIQFAEYGAVTKVLACSEIESKLLKDQELEVLVINAETRHLPAQDAYHLIYNLVRKAAEQGISHIYKKTDSGLRGNIGSELSAVIAASGEKFLPFIPALPAMNRVTTGGIHYVDGVMIHKSEFGIDPFEPVTSPFVKDLFTGEVLQVELFGEGETYQTDVTRATVGIFDACTEEDIRGIAEYLYQKGQLKVMAGCAGFASVLPELLGIGKREIKMPKLSKPLLVACGSINPITKRQIEFGEKEGYIRIVMEPEQLLGEEYLTSEQGKLWMKTIEESFDLNQVVMIDTGITRPQCLQEYLRHRKIPMEEARVKIAGRIGEVLRDILLLGNERTLMIIGGDTLMSFVRMTECKEIEPICEVEPGSVLSVMVINQRKIWVISKSGGFGRQEVLQTVAQKCGSVK